MKYTINQITEGEDEVIINYLDMTPEVERIVKFLKGEQTKLIGLSDKTITVIDSKDILYIESVDGKTFAYTDKDVLKIDYTLNQIEGILSDINFFRCSKSMIINIDRIASLKSLPSNRIDAKMQNGERVMISRTYASDFRKRLKGGRDNE
ncbi:LytTR family DNA-binding domain-containing protein [Anaerosporobacter sp.]